MCERAHVYEVPTTKSVTVKIFILNKVLVNNKLKVKGDTINHIGNTNSIFNEEVFLAWL